MRRMAPDRVRWLLAVAVASMLAIPTQAGAPTTVRIGMIRTMFRDIPEAMIAPLSKPFQALMERQTGRPGEINLSQDAHVLAERLIAGEVDLGVFHGFEYAWVQENHPELKALVVAVPNGQTFQACLVMREDSGSTGWEGLAGKTVALPRGSREHCRLYLERHQVQSGGCEIVEPDSVMTALDDVVDGLTDAVVVEAAAMESFQRTKPGRARQLGIIARSEMFPLSVVVYRDGALDSGTLSRFQSGLLQAQNTGDGRRMMLLWKLRGFAQVPDDYASQLEAIRRIYPAPAPQTVIGGE